VSIDFKSWYDNHFHSLTNNGLWLRGGEINTLSPDEFEKRDYRVILTRLSTYWDTADSFTHKLLYQMITGQGDMYADLAYLPPLSDADLFEQYGVPWIIGTSSKQGACAFDMIALSNSIVQEIVNIPAMLRRSGIPLRKSERLLKSDIPLVILGGANALYSSALHASDPVVDGIFVGEDAVKIKDLFRIARECKINKLTKKETLERLESVDGFYQPDTLKKTVKFTPAEIGENDLLHSGPVMYTEEQMGCGNLAISEGCPCFCSFCAESWGRKPYRELSIDKIRTAATAMKAAMGLETLELYSFNFNMHRDFYPILAELSVEFASLGLKSQRFDMIAYDPEIVKCLHAVGKTSITCGLEGISGKMRRYLHKSLNERELKLSLSMLIRAPIRELKIFLVATGKETKEDFDEFCALLGSINDMITMAGRKPRIIFSMTPLVRFPYTPLEREDAPEPLQCREVVLQTERFVNSRGFEFRDSADHNDYYLSQILVRAQDERVVNAIFNAILNSRFVYYREVTPELIRVINAELKRADLTYADVLCGLTAETIEKRPVSINVNQSFMETQADAAHDFKDNGYCIGTADNEGTCHACGACSTAEQIASITALRKVRHVSPDILRKRVKERSVTIPAYFRVTIPYASRGIPRKNTGIALARALMLTDNRLVTPFHSYKGSFIGDTFENPWITGDDCIRLDFHHSAQALLDELLGDQSFIDRVNAVFGSAGTIKGIGDFAEHAVTLTFESQYALDIPAFLNKYSVKYTTRKTGDTRYTYELTKDGVKKKVVTSCSSLKTERGWEGCIVPSEKFDCNEFITTAFAVNDPQERVRITISAVVA